MSLNENLRKAAEAIDDADAIFITSGAGVGVDSGLPDFRGNEGFWKAYPPLAKLNIAFYEMANPRWFFSNPDLAWGFYGHRLNLYRVTVPHNGFNILLEIGMRKPGGYFVFTSNVDGQYQKAGFDDKSICECHGSIHHLQCVHPCSSDIWKNDIEIEIDLSTFKPSSGLPKCNHCPSLARPNILMFGDWSWIGSRTDNQYIQMGAWLTKLKDKKIVVVECGAGLAVPSVRLKSEEVARQFDTTLVRINPRDFQTPQNGISIPLAAKEGIERIFDFVSDK